MCSRAAVLCTLLTGSTKVAVQGGAGGAHAGGTGGAGTGEGEGNAGGGRGGGVPASFNDQPCLTQSGIQRGAL